MAQIVEIKSLKFGQTGCSKEQLSLTVHVFLCAVGNPSNVVALSLHLISYNGLNLAVQISSGQGDEIIRIPFPVFELVVAVDPMDEVDGQTTHEREIATIIWRQCIVVMSYSLQEMARTRGEAILKVLKVISAWVKEIGQYTIVAYCKQVHESFHVRAQRRKV